MRSALREGELALKRQEVPVGCVVVRPSISGGADTLVCVGSNETNESKNATRHAELVAIDALLRDGGSTSLLGQCELYVTVEPCIMCASALSQLGIGRVVFGCHNDRFGGCGSVLELNNKAALPASPEHRGFPCSSGLLRDEAVAMLRRFYSHTNANAPVPKPRGTAALAAKKSASTCPEAAQH